MPPKFHRDASGRLTFELSQVPSDRYQEMCREIADHFGLAAIGEPVSGLDEIFQDYSADHGIIGIEWDTWSGFLVVAKVPAAEELLRGIADYLTKHYGATS